MAKDHFSPSTTTSASGGGQILFQEGGSAAKAICPDLLLRLRYDALMRQLEAMRALQERSAARFFSWVTLSIGTLLSVYVIATAMVPSFSVLLPFLVVTAGVQASFYLHSMDFARVCARAMESRINRLLEAEILIAARLEEAYSYPLDEPKLGGITLGKPERFFSAYALHWCCVWLFFFLAGALSGWSALDASHRIFYAVSLGTWAGLNGLYLAWYFIGRYDIAAVQRILDESDFSPIVGASSSSTAPSARA